MAELEDMLSAEDGIEEPPAELVFPAAPSSVFSLPEAPRGAIHVSSSPLLRIHLCKL